MLCAGGSQIKITILPVLCKWSTHPWLITSDCFGQAAEIKSV